MDVRYPCEHVVRGRPRSLGEQLLFRLVGPDPGGHAAGHGGASAGQVFGGSASQHIGPGVEA